MKKVSVILTTYNSAKTIQRAIDSVLSQNGIGCEFNVEMLIVDDCSNDLTLKIIEKNNLEYYSTGQNSGGPNKGRNIGLHKATGDYICIMDHDDEWLPDKLKAQLSVCELAPIISAGYTEINYLTGMKKDYFNPSSNGLRYNSYPSNSTFLNHLTRSHRGQVSYIGGLMYHFSLKNILFEEKYSMVDFDWFLRLMHHQPSVEVCRPLYIRHISGDNLSLNEKYRLNDYKHSIKTLRQFSVDYPYQVKIAERRINGTMGRYYYKMEKMNEARKYFLLSERKPKIWAYYLTSFFGYKIVNKIFKVF
jgi:glycosyltransferase involved in cell wall biosynthesis